VNVSGNGNLQPHSKNSFDEESSNSNCNSSSSNYDRPGDDLSQEEDELTDDKSIEEKQGGKGEEIGIVSQLKTEDSDKQKVENEKRLKRERRKRRLKKNEVLMFGLHPNETENE